MQISFILNILGFLYVFLALTMVLPLSVSLYYGDGSSTAFLYAMLVHAGTAASGGRGALVMLGFGLGTSAALLSVGLTAHLLGVRLRAALWRFAGMAVAMLGSFQLLRHGDKFGWW